MATEAPSSPDRSQVLAAVATARAFSLLGIVLTSVLIVVELIALVESRPHVSCRKAKSRAPFWLLSISITGFYVLLTCVLMWWLDWTNNEAGCSALVAPVLPLAYIVMKQCLYLFLFDRAKVVHDALKMNYRSVKTLRWVVFISATLGIPLGIWWTFFLYWRGRVMYPERVCLQYAVNMAGIIAVATIDCILSCAMLALFIAPMSRHMRRVRDDELSPLFRRLVRRNLIVSCLMMISTMTSLITMSVELSIAFGENPDPSTEHLQLWATFAPMLDTILTVLLPHTLSSSWVPAVLRKYISWWTTPRNLIHQQMFSTIDSVSKQQGGMRVGDDAEGCHSREGTLNEVGDSGNLSNSGTLGSSNTGARGIIVT